MAARIIYIQIKMTFLYLHLNIIGSDILGFLAERPAGRRVPASDLAPRSLLEGKEAHGLVPQGTSLHLGVCSPSPGRVHKLATGIHVLPPTNPETSSHLSHHPIPLG